MVLVPIVMFDKMLIPITFSLKAIIVGCFFHWPQVKMLSKSKHFKQYLGLVSVCIPLRQKKKKIADSSQVRLVSTDETDSIRGCQIFAEIPWG